MVLCNVAARVLGHSGVVVGAARQILRNGMVATQAPVQFQRFLSVSSAVLSERRYTDKHEWVLVDGAVGVVGISQYAQEALGDVVFAQLPDIGTELTQKDECGALESVKAASELYSPISGAVVEKNTAVEESPGLINSSCYENGWLFKVKISRSAEVDALMNETQYQEYLKSADH